jgi:hypothetical protein
MYSSELPDYNYFIYNCFFNTIASIEYVRVCLVVMTEGREQTSLFCYGHHNDIRM